jgi:NAD(P)-dependent dehydrogenase (short-subunit alcohol dehydrogenase family)
LQELNGKVAIVTGASIGIGKGIAEAFCNEGAKVVLAARSKQKLDDVANHLRAEGRTVLSVPTDVSREAEVKALFKKTMQEFGRLDILVNNAGIFHQASLEEMPLELWQRTIDVDLTGPFLCTREAIKIMKPQGGGRIINIGSISAQMPRPNAAAYSCAKIALVALTKTTALEGRGVGILASCIHPGNVNTEQMTETPNEPMMNIDAVVKAVMTMATLPANVNMVEAIVLPATQAYLGRG